MGRSTRTYSVAPIMTLSMRTLGAKVVRDR
jgi:hypothetical protein